MKHKRIFPIFVLAIMIIAMSTVLAFAASTAADVSLTASTAPYYRGGTVEVELTLKNITDQDGIAGIYIDQFDYDTDVLTFVSASYGELPQDWSADISGELIMLTNDKGNNPAKSDNFISLTVVFSINSDAPFGVTTISAQGGGTSNDEDLTEVEIGFGSVDIEIECNHVFDQKITDAKYFASSATCTKKATYYYSCTCGAKGSTTFETGDFAPHSFTVLQTSDTEHWYKCANCSATDTHEAHKGGTATCTEKAECSVCHVKYGNTLPHTYDQKNTDAKYLASPATCTKKATYYYSCTCGAKGSTTFESGDLAAHSFTVLKTNETEHWYQCANCSATDTHEAHKGGTATCTEKAECSVCHVKYGNTIPHTYDQKNTDAKYLASAATCTKKATYYYSCTCGAKGSTTFESGSTLPHTYDQKNTDSKYLASAATCTKKATYYYSCTCGEKGSTTFESGSTLPHTYDQKNTDVKYLASAATCTKKATYYYSCTCGAKGSATFESGDLAPHSFTVLQTSETEHWYKCANCTATSGHEAHKGGAATCTEKAECSVCHVKYGNTIPHTYDQKNTDAKYLASVATCTKKATYYYSCTCGAKGSTTFESGDLAAHSFTKYVYNNDATCTKDGTETATCDHCSATDTRTKSGSKIPHVFETYQSNHDATCLKDGTETALCKYGCGATDTRTVSGSKLGHLFEHYQFNNDATCTKDGTETSKCSRCDVTDTRTKVGSKADHHADSVWHSSAEGHYHLCTDCQTKLEVIKHTPGAAATEKTPQVCTVCGYVITPALGHTHSLSKVSGEKATCTHDGHTEYYTCSGCSDWFSDSRGTKKITDHNSVVIPATGHKVVQDAGVPATCTKDGKTAGSHCSVCGEVLEEQRVIHSTGHTEVDDPEIPATCHAEGKTAGKHCSSCGEVTVPQTTIPQLEHTIVTDPGKKATCTESGLTDGSHCSACGDVIEAQQIIEATGHRYNDYGYDSNGHWQICEICGEKSDTHDHNITLTVENEKYVRHCECGYTTTEEIGGKIDATDGDLTLSLDVIDYNRNKGDGSLTVSFEDGAIVTYNKTALASIAATIGSGNVKIQASEVNMETAELNNSQRQALEGIPAGSTLFDISLEADGVVIHNFEGGKATITMPFTLPAGWKANEVAVYRIEEDGTKTLMKTEYKDGKVTWETDGHSFYLVTQSENKQNDSQLFGILPATISLFGIEFSTLIPIIAVAIILIVAIVVVVFVIIKKKKHKLE